MPEIESKPIDTSRSRASLHGFRRSFHSLAMRTSRKDIAAAQKVFNVFPGENIQQAIEAANNLGGGTVFLKNGTYLPQTNLTLYSNITLEGESQDGVIIDFGSQNLQMRAIGSTAYTTGTIAINDGSATVTGSGTTFTAAMVGQFILISGTWFAITGFGSTTSLTIESVFTGENLTGEVYAIATILSNIDISKITITGSTASTGALYFQYCDSFYVDKFVSLSNTRGLGFSECGVPTLTNFSAFDCGSGLVCNHVGSVTFNSFIIADTTAGDGVSLTKVSDSEISNFISINASGNGLSLTNCTDIGILDWSIEGNGGKGIELISGNKRIQFSLGDTLGNASDGVKLTASSNYTIIGSIVFKSNGGYGLNIANSTCGSSIIIGNAFDANTAGEGTNSGTATKIRSNIGLADN